MIFVVNGIAAAAGLVQREDLEAGLVLLGAVVAGGLSQIGVNHRDPHLAGVVSVGLHKDLSQNALAGQANSGLVVLIQVALIEVGTGALQNGTVFGSTGLLVDVHTVNGDLEGVVLDDPAA